VGVDAGGHAVYDGGDDDDDDDDDYMTSKPNTVGPRVIHQAKAEE
jgi:hypothetical protein